MASTPPKKDPGDKGDGGLPPEIIKSRKSGNYSDINSRENGITLLNYILNALHKFPQKIGNYSDNEEGFKRKIVPVFRELLKPQRWAMLEYYFTHGAATVWILRYNLGISKTRAYDWHKLIEESGLVDLKTTISPVGKMKRTARIWGLPDSTEAQIQDAYQYHLQLTSPIYRKADKLTKAYLEAGRSPRPTRGELMTYLKEINEPPRMIYDLAKMMLDIFSRREARAPVREREVQDIADQIIDKLPRPLTMQSTPIYDVMNDLGVDSNDIKLRRELTETVLRSIKEIQEAEAGSKRLPSVA